MMTLDRPRAVSDHNAMDDMAEYACPEPDQSLCCGELLEPPETTIDRLERMRTVAVVLFILVLGIGWKFLDA